METTKLSELTLTTKEFLRILLYGVAGTGKTTLAGTFPTPMLIFDFDKKLKPLYGIQGIEAITYSFEKPSDGAKQWQKFLRDFREAKADLKWKTLVFDSLTNMDIILLLHCMILAGKGAEDKPTLPIYGDMSEHYKWFFSELNAITNRNVIVTAHLMENRSDSDDDSGQGLLLDITPLITGSKTKIRLPAMFEEVYFLERRGGEKDERVLHYKPYRKAIATSTIMKGVGNILNPTFEKLWGEINSCPNTK